MDKSLSAFDYLVLENQKMIMQMIELYIVSRNNEYNMSHTIM